jgi:hypothetical protein
MLIVWWNPKKVEIIKKFFEVPLHFLFHLFEKLEISAFASKM